RRANRRGPPRDRLAMTSQLQAAPQLIGLAHRETRLRDLLDLVPEQLEPPLDLPRLDRQVGELAAVLTPALGGARHLGAQAPVARVRVEQLALPALVEQPRLLVLTVDLDERPDVLGQPRRRHRGVVEAGGRAPARADLAARD